MKNQRSVLKYSLLAGLLGSTLSLQAMAWVLMPGEEHPSQSSAEYWNAETGEISNTIRLNQRVGERELDTERGLITIPYSAKIVDKRPIDEWYDARPAKATFYGRENKIIRVEISY